jgi:aminopeptidase N
MSPASHAASLPLFLVALLACRAAPPSGAPGPAPALAEAPRVEAQASAPELAPTDGAGALELGDPYYPGLGNGGYEVEHYDLALDLVLDSDELTGLVTLRANALQALARFSLDLYGLEVTAVTVDGVAARFERNEPVPGPRGAPPRSTELIVHAPEVLAAGASFTVAVAYEGEPGPRPDPAVPFLKGTGWQRLESGVYVMAECIGASGWFPCNDHPRDKATYSFRVSVEQPYTVAANGILKEVLEEGERRTFVFDAPDPMATYLVTLNAAEFALIHATGPRGIPVTTYHPPLASEEELEPFRRQPEVLEFLETVFGPYPFVAAGAVVAHEGLPGALECQTIPVYGRGLPLEVVVHELAHQWYGDCVSPDLWRDMWLNEGFATYSEWLWVEHELGSAAYRGHALDAYRQLRARGVGSPFDPGVEAVFSGRVYTRGAMVLHGLRQEVGDEVFFRILKSWVESRRNGNASTAQFTAHAAEVAGRDLAPFFEAWLYAPVTPEVAEFEPAAPAPGQ